MNSVLTAKIVCPRCHAEVEAHHTWCPACQASLGAASPTRAIDRPWILVVLVLHVGLLGIPIYWRTRYAMRTRVLICLASVAYTLFAVSFIGWVGWWLIRQFTGW